MSARAARRDADGDLLARLGDEEDEQTPPLVRSIVGSRAWRDYCSQLRRERLASRDLARIPPRVCCDALGRMTGASLRSLGMNSLSITLFGRFTVRRGNDVAGDFRPAKVRELFAYLLIYRGRPHHREALADALWNSGSTCGSRKGLRQALWRLQAAIKCHTGSPDDCVLLVDRDWVQISPQAGLSLDVREFEEAFGVVHGVPGRLLDPCQVQTVDNAVQLYQGDLLEGWYQEWCVYERERLQQMYLAMLDKLMEYCETRQEYESGLLHGVRILRHEPARERTHRRLMRLYYMAGDRTAALRQYERCVAALRTDLEVDPAKRTEALCELIRADEFNGPALR